MHTGAGRALVCIMQTELKSSRFLRNDSYVGEILQEVQRAVAKAAGCPVRYLESAIVPEGWSEQVAWEGTVDVFVLDGHPKAKRAYGWLRWDGHCAAVLEIPPVDSPDMAVRVVLASREHY